MFNKFTLDFTDNIFQSLYESTKFENICKGRMGAIMVDSCDIIPIVRSTAKYNMMAQQFLPIHHIIIEKINKVSNMNLRFNNILVEVYDNEYITMGYHHDMVFINLCFFNNVFSVVIINITK